MLRIISWCTTNLWSGCPMPELDKRSGFVWSISGNEHAKDSKQLQQQGAHCVYLFLNSLSKTAPFGAIAFHLCFLLLSLSNGDLEQEALPWDGKECVHKSSFAAWGFFFLHTWMEEPVVWFSFSFQQLLLSWLVVFWKQNLLTVLLLRLLCLLPALNDTLSRYRGVRGLSFAPSKDDPGMFLKSLQAVKVRLWVQFSLADPPLGAKRLCVARQGSQGGLGSSSVVEAGGTLKLRCGSMCCCCSCFTTVWAQCIVLRFLKGRRFTRGMKVAL